MAYQYQYPPAGSGQWSSGICGCFQDFESCMCAWCCPCVLVGQIAEIVDQGATSCGSAGAIYALLTIFTGCGCLYSCGFRAKLRHKYGLPLQPCGDVCTEWCCTCCSLAQQYRELNSRGINPVLGYEANKATYETQAPPMQKMYG